MSEVQVTPAEARQRYRDIGGELPSDYALARDYGDAVAGAAQWLDEQGLMRETERPIAELTDAELDGLRRDSIQ